MKNNSRLLTVLYIISRLSFRLCQLVLLFSLIFELIPEGTIGDFSSSIHNSKGYPVDIGIQLNIPDSLISYRNSLTNSSGIVSKIGIKKFDEDFDIIKKDSELVKTYQINKLEIYDRKFVEIKKEVINPIIGYQSSKIKLTLNPENYFFKAVLILKNYLSAVVMLFISFQFMHLFKNLKTNFAFNNVLNKKIKNIGYSLIGYQVLNFTGSLIVMQYLSRINYNHYISSIVHSRFNFMNLTTVPEYSLNALFMGLCCLVLAKLLNYGYELQNENDLTI